MNSAEIRDSKVAIMPLAATRNEVNLITESVNVFHLDNSMQRINEEICVTKVKTIYIVGSGDSYALSLIYANLFTNNVKIPAYAIQSYEFIQQVTAHIDESYLIVVLSSSGRISPVADALIKAQGTAAQVLGITNSEASYFASVANHFVTTGATKAGMPTQSSIVTALYLDALGCMLSSSYYSKFTCELAQLKHDFTTHTCQLSDSFCKAFVSTILDKKVILLGSGINYGLAVLFSNLLYCGPQKGNTVLYIEEYMHALRVNQSTGDELVIVIGQNNNDSIFNKLSFMIHKNGGHIRYIDNDCLQRFFSNTNNKLVSDTHVHRYHFMVLIFKLIISATEKYISGGGHRVSTE